LLNQYYAQRYKGNPIPNPNPSYIH
jgi:hypothetical protein